MKSYPELGGELEAGIAALGGDIPATMGPFGEVVGGALGDGVLDARTKELIALAIAVAVHCDPCIAHHSRAVLKAGASRAEIAEALGVAVLMGGGPAVAYSVAAMQAVDQFSAA